MGEGNKIHTSRLSSPLDFADSKNQFAPPSAQTVARAIHIYQSFNARLEHISVNLHTVLDSVTVYVDGSANGERDIWHTMFS